MRPRRWSVTELPRRSSDHGINSAQAVQSVFSLRLNAFGSDVFAWHGRCPAEAIGAISRSVARGYARGTSSISTKSQAGGYNPQQTGFVAPASFLKVSHRRTAIKSNQAVAESSALARCSTTRTRQPLHDDRRA